MENLGSLAILLAFCFAVYAIIGSLAGKWAGRPLLTLSAERAVYSVWVALSTAGGILVYSLFKDDFRMVYVWAHSNRTMPTAYKFTAWWGGMEGSLMFWAWLLSTYSVVVAWQNRKKLRDMMPYVITVLMATETFFLIMIGFVASPFKMIAAGRGIIEMPDGQGLNPLLQHWGMVIHPPMLYLGYVGFVVPFAFAMASLATKQKGDSWIHTTRRWTLVTWMFQSTGILLGSGWSYSVLGWGGYWKWDPVENASLLPWITGTAFLHSVMMQEKKGMMKVWNMVLISSTFFLCIFGTTLTRSGMVQSVHAFSEGPIGKFFVTFLTIGVALTLYLILSRLEYLKSESSMEAVLSRESAFMFNNLVLLASCFAVLWGTLFPVITEAVMGEKISVDEPFFNRVNIPIAMFLLLLTGVGPLIAWRKSSVESLKRAFLWPTVSGFAVSIILFALGIHHFYALMSFGLCTFVVATVALEFFKGAGAISAKSGQNLLAAMVELTHRNTRRYGGYLVHVGIVIIFAGFTGAAFNQNSTVEIAKGQPMQLGAYTLTVNGYDEGEADNYRWGRVHIAATKHGQAIADMEPERRFYPASQTPTSQIALRRRLDEDLYINYSGPGTTPNSYIIQAYVFPLVNWIWIGYWVVLIGTLICMIPSKSRLIYPRTEVVGIAGKHAAGKHENVEG